MLVDTSVVVMTFETVKVVSTISAVGSGVVGAKVCRGAMVAKGIVLVGVSADVDGNLVVDSASIGPNSRTQGMGHLSKWA